MTSAKEGMCSPLTELFSEAASMEALTLTAVQGQQPWAVKATGAGGLYSQAGFSQTSSHLGRGHIRGLRHFQSQLVASQRGAPLGLGGMEAAWQTGGGQTGSHLGQSSFSHRDLGQRTEQAGFSQCTSHLGQGSSSHCIWHLGRAQMGWQTAGQAGSSHCHLHWGWHWACWWVGWWVDGEGGG